MAYDAFISYSHSADGRVAPAIRDGLQKLAKPWNKRRALNVFLDQASLEASPGLRTTLVEHLVGSGFSGTVEWWRLGAGGESTVALAPASQSGVAVGPDAVTVATAGVDGVIRLWPPPDSWLGLACDGAARNMTADEWEDLGRDPDAYVRHCAAYPPGVGAPDEAPAADY